MKNKYVLFLIIALLFVTVVLAVIYAFSSESIEEGCLSVSQNGAERTIPANELPLHKVEGIQKNAKGEEKRISASGIELSALADQPFVSARVTADDGYSAAFNAEETDAAFLLYSEEGRFSLVVFSDADSKRSVKNVKYVEFE